MATAVDHAPEMELVIHTGGGSEQAYASGRFMPRKPRDIGQFAPTPADSRSFAELQDDLRRLEQLAAEQEREAAAAAPEKAGANAERAAAQRAHAARAQAALKAARADAARGARSEPLADGSGLPGGAAPSRTAISRNVATDVVTSVAAHPVSKTEPGPDDIVVRCEDPYCTATFVLRATRARPLPTPPEGNWFCARCTSEARGRGIRLFDRVIRTRQVPAGARKVTQYLVRYWDAHEEDDEWLNHEEMQRLEVSCKGV
ncbi:hypothetical protein KFE25_012535 [Diacronema lutheri]|uniref:Uncharacterized protein n=2 Tax=Diacronema lutheri TaxID=2081491 RepID=A0A8J6C883_DIALT|nr:hypothetical protein KFE25_012535 [Diacronema lutheri]